MYFAISYQTLPKHLPHSSKIAVKINQGHWQLLWLKRAALKSCHASIVKSSVYAFRQSQAFHTVEITNSTIALLLPYYLKRSLITVFVTHDVLEWIFQPHMFLGEAVLWNHICSISIFMLYIRVLLNINIPKNHSKYIPRDTKREQSTKTFQLFVLLHQTSTLWR